MARHKQSLWTDPVRLVLIALLLWPCSTALAAPAEDPEDSDFPPGLLATYTAGDVSIQRLDPDIAFDWQQGSPDLRLPPGSFSVTWDGAFLIRNNGAHRFHAYLCGEVDVLLDGKSVLKATASEPKWVSGELTDLNFGETELEINYRKTGSTAVVKLFWSSDKFPIEPLPSYLLYRFEGEPELAEIERGRLEFRARHCDRCHEKSNTLESSPGPSLLHAGTALEEAWIVSKLITPATQHEKMPDFKMTAEEAADIARYLRKSSTKSPQLTRADRKLKDKDREEGELLTRSAGCLACHVIGELGTDGLFGGGSLDGVGSKRSQPWLISWLENPARLNKHHRMPEPSLEKKEIQQVAMYLASLEQDPGSIDNAEHDPSMEHGRKLINRFGCVACHEIPGFNETSADDEAAAKPREYISLAGRTDRPGCLEPASDEKLHHRPHYPQADASAIQAWLKSYHNIDEENPHFREMSFARGADLLTEKNCLACHPRDRNTGIAMVAGEVSQHDKRLAGQSQGMIAPHLTAVGDRMHEESLAKGIRGDLPKRLPWLSVRMPKFKHSKTESDQLLHYLISHDRLPDPIPDERLQLSSVELTSAEQLLAGRELTGGRAFNCIACHKFGDYEPRNTALGTRGSDLLGIDSRLRAPYFLRWVSSPLRIVPGMEMPSYNMAKPGFAVHDVHDQLTVVWKAINSPDFKAPSNPTVVEQYFVVQPHEPSRVIRDVFELNASEKRTFIPRPFAVGLNNGHSLLFDLDQARLLEWTYGDFAAQEAEGKSWLWKLTGAPVVKNFSQPSDFVLLASDEKESSPIAPQLESGRAASLHDYQIISDGVQFTYDLWFPVDGRRIPVQIRERWTTAKSSADTGFSRVIEAGGIPNGYQLQLRQSAEGPLLGEPRLQAGGKQMPLGTSQTSLSFESQSDSLQTLQLSYLTALNNRVLTPFAEKPEVSTRPDVLSGTPGFKTERLPLSSNLMPTAFAWSRKDQLLVSSLKGQVYAVDDSDNDGLGDKLEVIASGLAAPFGLHVEDDSLYIAHKPDILKVENYRTSHPTVDLVADGWGHSDNYHDWVTGFAKDDEGNLYVATGSDYAQPKRDPALIRWRGDVLRINESKEPTQIGSALRYPIGIAADSRGRIFVSDQQGVQNCFNEINHIVPGAQYGVPALQGANGEEKRAAIQIPHPWTRSVNGIFFIPEDIESPGLKAFRGHGVGCEYNYRFLVRFSLQDVGGEVQGACYAMTESAEQLPDDAPVFLGPMCGTVGPDGNIYIGNIHDSGWRGGQNTGEIVRMTPQNEFPNGIREVRATADGFDIELLEPLDGQTLREKETYNLVGYTRVWEGDYATPDSGRYRPAIEAITVSDDGRTIQLQVDELRPAYVYELHLAESLGLFPRSAYYTMNRIPDAAR
ncbi:c-type cytochrome [Rubinisphaera margarita]|uniref:c-type cytochrome n=1 Tax=Rubinisphaera margarita TaxID=2909586 RepID=UPI001EE9A0F5|nr:c-type cytochrome [Rubinisphaera margarita]MCG6157032.1 PA14 domain-containing protein [Rubinisphaera margarita]